MTNYRPIYRPFGILSIFQATKSGLATLPIFSVLYVLYTAIRDLFEDFTICSQVKFVQNNFRLTAPK